MELPNVLPWFYEKFGLDINQTSYSQVNYCATVVAIIKQCSIVQLSQTVFPYNLQLSVHGFSMYMTYPHSHNVAMFVL